MYPLTLSLWVAPITAVRYEVNGGLPMCIRFIIYQEYMVIVYWLVFVNLIWYLYLFWLNKHCLSLSPSLVIICCEASKGHVLQVVYVLTADNLWNSFSDLIIMLMISRQVTNLHTQKMLGHLDMRKNRHDLITIFPFEQHDFYKILVISSSIKWLTDSKVSSLETV